MMRTSTCTILAILTAASLVLWGTPARAAETVDDVVKKARKYAGDGDLTTAAGLLAQAAAKAHKRGNLAAERKLGNELGRVCARAPIQLPKTEATRARPTRARVLARAISGLDPTFAGAHVSAHALAYEMLIDAVETGDRTGVEAAEKALLRFARTQKTGLGADMLADFAKGLRDRDRLPEKDLAFDAHKPLDDALKACVGNGWQEAGIHVGAELVSMWCEHDKPELLGSTLDEVHGLLPDGTDGVLLSRWRTLGSRRFRPKSPEASQALERYKEFVRARKGPIAAAGAAGAGKSGDTPLPRIAGAWKRLSSKRPFASVKRGKSAFEMRHSFDKRFRLDVPFGSGQRTMDGAGVMAVLHGQSVALYFLDLTARNGAPASQPPRKRYMAWYLLAPNERWGLTKSGRILVTK